VVVRLGAGFGRGQGWRTGGTSPGGGQGSQVGTAQVGTDGLDAGTGDAQMDDVVIGPIGDRESNAGWPEPKLFTAHGQVARGRHHSVELHRATVIGHRGRWRVGVLVDHLERLSPGGVSGGGRAGQGAALR
jgi:hypothetical protein